MPKPHPKESKNAFLGRCVLSPELKGKSRDEKLAACYGIFREHRGESSDSEPPEGKSLATDPASQQTQEDQARLLAERKKKRTDGLLKKAADALAKYRKAKLICQVGAGPVRADSEKGGKGCGGECACKACTEKSYSRKAGIWITIGGHEEGDKKHVGGTRVLIDDESGEILGGGVPKELQGKKVGQFKELIEHHRKQEKEGKKKSEEKPASPIDNSSPKGDNDSGGGEKPKPEETKVGPKSQAEAKSFVEEAAKGYRVNWQEWANGTAEATISHPATRRFMGKIKIDSGGRMDLDPSAAEHFPSLVAKETAATNSQPQPSSAASSANKKIEGNWKKTSAGQVVAVVPAEEVGIRITGSGKVADRKEIAVGQKITVGDRTFTIAAIGSPFRVGKEQFIYLYPETPQKRHFAPAREEIPDDPIDRMEWEHRREQGRTGELPGA